MFFSPTLLQLHEQNIPVYILCLSKGDYNRLGNLRLDEFYSSCKQLNIPNTNYRVINDPLLLRDDPTLDWQPDAIIGHVKNVIQEWNINVLLTFDHQGISKHKNHVSIYRCLPHLIQQTKGRIKQVFVLNTVPLYRKYLTLIDLISYVMKFKHRPKYCFLLSRRHLLKPYLAMREHRSQLVWFRYLYMLFSRYIWINDYTRFS
ncbi:unnamed protein product [Didymodactylos carnosus]|uniref:N-acetylglucosaminylphosphatidylinositol deacetylase n=1 Tax=Didymodactylos carnosus TaxID=1234261 RepID=A0A814E0E7_9BILA|nr:unnamed protein product [Didymodactylos carnosus]CAF1534718.1 unnamed protein product [Didymodactylos carnosus]CAF3737302.1 unnamed protein product [Didymodactylos carnosus]CAF4322163.1 unnamed protein product [Didymodactylos carnosus]